jgi:nitrous oxidase accessory protein NosD
VKSKSLITVLLIMIMTFSLLLSFHLTSAQSDELKITAINAPNSGVVGTNIQVQISANYKFSSSALIAIEVIGPEGRIFYNSDYNSNTKSSGSGTKTYQYSLPVCSPGNFVYSISSWYYENNHWTKSEKNQIIITGYWSSKTWQVPQDYTNINDAVIAASPGDTIMVALGNYSGFIVDKAVRIIGAGIDQTVINSAVNLKSASCAFIQGFSIGFYGNLYLNCNNSIVSNCHSECDANINGNTNTIADCTINGKITVDGDYNTIVRSYIHSDIYHHGIEILNGADRIIGLNTIDSCIVETTIGDSPYVDYYAIVTQYSTGTVIKNSTIRSPYGIGIKVGDHCEALSIIGNKIENSDKGIYVSSFTDNVTSIDFNTIKNCTSGLSIAGGYNLEAHGNNFVNNQLNAIDDSYYSVWYDNGKGNYWSDWVSPDANGDGIVDKPYVISGYTRSSDQYPLVAMTSWIPTADQTPTVTSTPTASPSPITSSTPTPIFTTTPTPTPSVPELQLTTILTILLTITAMLVTLGSFNKRRK